MVTVSVKPPGKPAFDLELAGKKAEQVTVAQLKASIHQKFPKVSGEYLQWEDCHTHNLTSFTKLQHHWVDPRHQATSDDPIVGPPS